ncbi:MAG: hypothetical protein GX661_02825 [Acholeplasmataceae bacterium]|nr:hypothetical protein [Acholeplasmataceae bacterium]
MKEEEALLKKDLKVCEYHSQKIYEEVEKLKKKLNEKELLEVEEYENQLIEKMNSQMGKKIPELQLLEDRMASVLSGDINFLKSANTMTKVIVIGKIIVSIFLLITAFGFDDYGVYQGMRIIISVLGLGLAICLIGSTFSEQYKIKNNFNTFISLDIMYNILVFFMFAFSSMRRAGWIIIDIFFIIIYLVFAICIDKYRPILKCK